MVAQPQDDGARALTAMGDRHRRAILAMLAEGERSVRELSDELPISRPAVSRHLRLLKEARLVEQRPLGTRRLYRLRRAGFAATQSYLDELWTTALARFRLVAENRPQPARAEQTAAPEDEERR